MSAIKLAAAAALLFPYEAWAPLPGPELQLPLHPDDEALPPAEPLAGWSFTGLLAQLEVQLHVRRIAPAVTYATDTIAVPGEVYPWVVEATFRGWPRDAELGAERTESITLTWPAKVDPRLPEGREAVVRALERLVLHEMREGVELHGKRILDPHEPPKPGPARAAVTMSVSVRIDGLGIVEAVVEALRGAYFAVVDTVADEHREVAAEAVETVSEIVMEALQAAAKVVPQGPDPVRAAAERLIERLAAQDVQGLSEASDALEAALAASPAPAPPDVLHDMLSLVMDGKHPSVEAIEAWTDQQRGEAERWAAHEHLIASDHDDVERLPRPAFLEGPKTVGEWLADRGLGTATQHGYDEPGESDG